MEEHMRHEFKKIEPKWQKKWAEQEIFKAVDGSEKPKFYGLVEFPYPSGAGMHVGHIKAYSSIEVIARKRRMEGYNVLFPIGFDAFGLPTENYAIKTSTHPRIITDKNIHRFSEQLKSVGFSFDWSRVIDTTDPDFYKWTQWIFLKMFEKGLVFRDKTLVNYCPSCKVVLSNEDSQGGKCDICHSDVIQKSKDVWYLRLVIAAVGCALGELVHCDYGAMGVALIVVLYLMRESRFQQCITGAICTYWELPAPLAFIPIWFYNGERGRQPKWFFYWFYPVHLLIYGLIGSWILPGILL